MTGETLTTALGYAPLDADAPSATIEGRALRIEVSRAP